MPKLITQLTRFALVGSIGLVIDVALFNALRLTVLSPEALNEGPFIAKAISTSVAIVANWMGNRHWTFARERRGHLAREGLEFFIVSAGGMLIGLACLWVSHYVLGFTSLLADNISSNVIGLALGTAFRFWGYRVWVFREAGASTGSGAAVGVVGARGSRYAAARLLDQRRGPAKRTVAPAGFAPASRIQTVATVDDDSGSHD